MCGPPYHKRQQHYLPRRQGLLKPEARCLVPANSFAENAQSNTGQLHCPIIASLQDGIAPLCGSPRHLF